MPESRIPKSPWRFMIYISAPFKWRVIVVWLSVTMASALSIAAPYAVKEMIDAITLSIYATLSLPKELRHRKFTDFQKQLESESKNPGEVMKSFVEASKRHGFGIGYHTSPNDIKPDEQGRWTIKGFESDHRDDDLSKAYYSTKYRHLFKRRDPKFIYIVRTDPSTHRTDGNWSRAGMLSVVARVPFGDVVEYVEKNVRDIEKKKAGD